MKVRMLTWLLPIALAATGFAHLLFLGAGAVHPGTGADGVTVSFSGKVVAVADGDTISVMRDGGDWVQIVQAQTGTFVDTTAPLVPGQPETREYRAQGMAGNARVGDLSPVVSVVTLP